MNKRIPRKGLRLLAFICLYLLLPPFTTIADDSPASCIDNLTPSHPLARRKNSHHSFTHVIGLFDVHEGERCHLLRPGGMEQVLMTIVAFENRLMDFAVNESEIGFYIYDTCSNTSVSLRHLIHALTETKVLEPSCNGKRYLGVLGPKNSEIQRDIKNFMSSLRIPYVPLMTTSLKEEIEAVVRVLADLKWKMVAVFASSKSLEVEFQKEADEQNICVASYVTVPSYDKSDAFLQLKFQEIKAADVQVAVILGSGINLKGLHEMLLVTNSTLQYWLVAGVDTENDVFPIFFSSTNIKRHIAHSDHPVIVFRKSAVKIPILDTNIEETYNFDAKIKQLNLVQSYIEYMNSCRKDISGNVLNDSRCNDQLRHSTLQRTMVEESVDLLLKNMMNSNLLKYKDTNETIETFVEDFNQSTTGIEIWTYQHGTVKFSKHKEVQVGHYNNNLLNWDKKLLNIFRAMGSGWFKIPEFYCQQNCRDVCKNFKNISMEEDMENLFSRIYHWKHETWVNILLTVSCVGIIIALLTIIFLTINSCREDFDEGSQISNVIVLVSVIFSYCCTVLFMFHKDSVACYRRLTIVGVAYGCMLSPILSRCFLLIAAEMDGIHAHVSGFLQSILCFFIAGIQFAMAVYYWISHENTKNLKFRCIFDVKSTVGYLSYPMVVSFIWLISSPFCAKSRRNNREGLLLHFGSIAVCIVWLVWYLLFFLLHSRWNEFTICFGLVTTATVIVVVIFLPKVYKIVVSTAAKEHGQVSMQPVIFASTSSRSPNLSIYESVNHGFNPDKDGFVVDVFRDEDESPRLRKMTHL